jgi:Zn finger protein HypA/HybF involved in hydrogenase expression
VLEGFNDLASTFPDIAVEADGWNPREFTPYSKKKMNWKCKNGHKWSAVIGNRTTDHHCPSCAVSGFDVNQDGYLYFLSHEVWAMMQIGITNFPEQRLRTHQKLGWSVVEVRGPMSGLEARHLEQAILKALRANQILLGIESPIGKFDGYTECWRSSEYSAINLKELITLARSSKLIDE